MLLSTLLYFFFMISMATVHCNLEGDSLNALKISLIDPNNVLQSWDPTLINPCTWFHITCNAKNSVVRVDLGAAALSGPLVPELGNLINLQYLQLQQNNISGSIPREVGKLGALVSLGLEQNKLSGSIPASLGKLKSLKYMTLNSNGLSGKIPTEVIQLIHWGNLRTMNLSDNQIAGTIGATKSTGFATTTIIQDPKAPK